MPGKVKVIPKPGIPKGQRREIIVDSGASKHMIGIKQLMTSERKSIRKLSQPFLVQTAHGIVSCHLEAQIYIHDLGIWIWAQLLEDSPAVLSLGLLCQDMGFGYSCEEGATTSYLQKGEEVSRVRPLQLFPR